MSRRSNSIDMCSGPLFMKILKFFIPFFLTGFLQRLYHAADVIVVGQFAGETALAAVGAPGSINTLLNDLFIGLSAGVSVALGRALGAKDEETANRVVHTAVLISILAGGFVMVMGLIFIKPLLILTNLPAEILPGATIYMRILFLGKIPIMIYTFGAAIIRAKGDSKRPLYIITVSGIINVVLNLFFVIVLKMEVAGVALATIISYVYNALSVIYLLRCEEGPLFLSFKKLKIYKKQLGDIMKVGIPTGLQSMVFSLTNILIQSSVNGFGALVIAGNTAGSSIGGFIYGTYNGFLHTSLTFVSQNVGAKKYHRIKKILGCCVLDILFVWVFTILLVFFAGETLLKIYIPNNTEALSYGMIRLWIMTCTYGFLGLMELFSGVLRGMGYSILVMMISAVGACGVRALWIFTVFQYLKTYESLFYSYAVSWIAATICLAACYLFIRRNKYKDIPE